MKVQNAVPRHLSVVKRARNAWPQTMDDRGSFVDEVDENVMSENGFFPTLSAQKHEKTHVTPRRGQQRSPSVTSSPVTSIHIRELKRAHTQEVDDLKRRIGKLEASLSSEEEAHLALKAKMEQVKVADHSVSHHGFRALELVGARLRASLQVVAGESAECARLERMATAFPGFYWLFVDERSPLHRLSIAQKCARKCLLVVAALSGDAVNDN